MNGSASIPEMLDALCCGAGACAWGVAAAAPVADADRKIFDSWIARGAHGPMDYMARYADVRADVELLLAGARSIVVCAFSYRQASHSAHISDYALGRDYHIVLRERLEQVAAAVRESFGGETRVCVDSAPLRERYWAKIAGVGTFGLNGKLIVPGAGADVVLGEIVCTAVLPATEPLQEELCDGCGRCVMACPASALDGRGGVDARKCLSCITIEHRGPLPEGVRLHGRLAGCDVCSRVCPADAREASAGCAATLPDLQARAEVLALTPAEAAGLTRGRFASLFRQSALMRLRLSGLRRNATYIIMTENQNEITQTL